MTLIIQQMHMSYLSQLLRESLLVYPIIETIHIVSMSTLLGIIFFFDLYLLKIGFRELSLETWIKKILPKTNLLLFVVFVSGFMLFYANPSRVFYNFWFRAKVLFMVIAFLNAIFFRLYWKVNYEKRRKFTAPISLFFLILIVVMARLMGYGWGDCRNMRSDFLYKVSNCANLEQVK